jgi:hypothetical protein
VLVVADRPFAANFGRWLAAPVGAPLQQTPDFGRVLKDPG